MKLTEGLGESLVQHLLSAANGKVPPGALDLMKTEILKSTNAVSGAGRRGHCLVSMALASLGMAERRPWRWRTPLQLQKFALDIGFIPRLIERLRSLPAAAGAAAEA